MRHTDKRVNEEMILHRRKLEFYAIEADDRYKPLLLLQNNRKYCYSKKDFEPSL